MRQLTEATKLLAHDVEYFTVVACSTETAATTFGHGAHAQDKAYIACSGLATMGISQYLRDRNRPDLVHYTYDKGREEGRRILKGFVDRLESRQDLVDWYRIDGIEPGSCATNVWLQAADFWVWEFGKELVLRADGQPIRRHFLDFINARRKKLGTRLGLFYYHRPDGEKLAEFSQWLDGLIANVPLLPKSEEIEP